MKKYRILFYALVALMFASCAPHKYQMEYFNDIDSMGPIEVGDYSVKIEPSDELYISVTSSSPEASAAFNLPLTNPANRDALSGTGNPHTQTYTVDPQGYINFPVLGAVYVKGLTVDQVREMLTHKIGEEVEDPVVSVHLVRFWVNVSGEVSRPGRISVAAPRFSILDALAQAGDLNQYGRRDNVLLIREEDGKLQHVRFNLNSADILTSPYFYLKQNDYIYVEPNDVRKDNAEYSTYDGYRLSVISTIVSASASIVSLIIALSR